MANKLNAVEMLNKLDADELDAQIDELERELESLKVLRKAVQVREEGKPARKPRARASAQPELAESEEARIERIRQKIFDYLTAAGPTKLRVIATEIGVTNWQSLNHIIKHEWFQRASEGRWSIAKTGGKFA